jgi:hypothetical protein
MPRRRCYERALASVTGGRARAEDVEPRRSGDQRGPNGGRPQHVAAGGQSPVPAVDHELRLEARGSVRLQLGGAGLDVDPRVRTPVSQ